jgi:hypothetical protein
VERVGNDHTHKTFFSNWTQLDFAQFVSWLSDSLTLITALKINAEGEGAGMRMYISKTISADLSSLPASTFLMRERE